ncbi:MAG: PrsW family intramembrane metalloprotease [bacterium]
MVHVLALLASFIPAVLWLWFFYSRDRYEREPKRLIGKLFLWGLLAGPWAAGMNELLGSMLVPVADSFGRAGAIPTAAVLLFTAVLLLALNEETMKYIVANNSIRSDPNFNEPLDGMVYLTTAALGFAAGENFIYIIGSYFGVLESAARAGAPVGAAAVIGAFGITAPMRALLSTIGHVSWSGLVGYFLARRVLGGRPASFVTIGVLLASVLHASYNFPLELQQRLSEAEGFVGRVFSGYFLATLLVWLISVVIYVLLFRRSLKASPFRGEQIAAPAAAEAPKPS